ncbi:hypothetical protein F5146DRAFT_492107 [Armillaria mellea]|nr:hypothetical protein F5146DRAFT_492107 [Armillaria mellea]
MLARLKSRWDINDAGVHCHKHKRRLSSYEHVTTIILETLSTDGNTATVEASIGPLFLVDLLDVPLVLVAYDKLSLLDFDLYTTNDQTRLLSKGVGDIRLTRLMVSLVNQYKSQPLGIILTDQTTPGEVIWTCQSTASLDQASRGGKGRTGLCLYARLERVDDRRVEGNYPSGIQSTNALDGDIGVIAGFEGLIEGQNLRCGWDAALNIDCRDFRVGYVRVIRSASDIVASLNALNGVGIAFRHAC